MKFQQIRQLLDFITKSVDTLEQACTESNMEIPSLDEPFDPAHRAFWMDPVTAEAAAVATAAASHLEAILSPPHAVLNYAIGGVSPIGLHIVEIAEK